MNEDAMELRAELLEDFFAECDEQLSTVRAQLAALEQAVDSGASNPGAIESVYRSVHSFKGNSAIVGLAPAEQLAHATEGLLRGLTRGEATLTGATLDLLGRATHRLEDMIAAFRAHHPVAPASDLLTELGGAPAAAAVPTAPPERTEPPASSGARAEEARARGLQLWHATFTPSPELDRRNVNVNSVRARLGELGEILGAAPEIVAGGRIRFDFTVALRQVPADLDRWEADAITWRAETPAAEPTAGNTDAAPAPTARPAPVPVASHIVRVDLSRLDELMRITGEMVIQRSRLEDRIANAARDPAALQEVNLAFVRSLRDLRAAIVRVRLVPVLEIFSRLPFVVRDLSRDTGKKVRLALEGQDTEIDKYIVERLREPLLHLVRNAISHGVESPEERLAAGKPAEATLLLRASAIGDSVQIQIRDDGRGVDVREVAARAEAAGLAVPADLDEPSLLRLICTPGFSTRVEADRASGRGVGMAVVDETVRDLGGSLTLSTVSGLFTQFTLRLPLTLSIAQALIVGAGPQVCAIPQGFVDEIVPVRSEDIRTINGVAVGPYRGGLLPLVRLRTLFGDADRAGDAVESPVLVIATERGAAGLVVDRVHGQREVVVRPMQDPLLRVPGVSGATELGDGRPVLILDAPTLAHAAALARPTLPVETTATAS